MINRMKKLTLAAAKSDISSVTNELVWLSSVEVNPLSEICTEEKTEGLNLIDISADISECESKLSGLKNAIDTLSKVSSKKKFMSLPQFLERSSFEKLSENCEEAYKLSEKIGLLTKRISSLRSECNSIDAEIISLSPWTSLDIPIGLSETKNTFIVKGSFPKNAVLAEIYEEILSEYPETEQIKVFEDTDFSYVCYITLKLSHDGVLSVLNNKGFSKVNFAKYEGTAGSEIERLKKEKEKINTEIEKVGIEICSYADKRSELEKYFDYYSSNLEELKVKEKLICTESVFILDGWIPENKTNKLAEKLSNFECYYELTDPTDDDNVPVELSNNKFSAPFEAVLSLYSYPAYKGYDPTKWMSVFYFIIFGLIMADVGYGLLLFGGCLLMMKLMRPKGGFKKYLQLFALCGVACIIGGVLFGSYFGDLPKAIATGMFGVKNFPSLYILMDPIQNPIGYLILSLVVGAVHLLWGMGLKAYMLIREGQVWDAIFDVGLWYLLFAGFALLAFLPTVGKWVSIAAAAGLVLTQGRAEKNVVMKFLNGVLSLYSIVGYVSDLLSYSRILALGLSGAIIASVVNIIGTIAGPSIGGFVCLILAFLFGHTLNIALSVLGAFVHTARLQYIEFFNKFYIDGGRVFKPVTIKTKYTDIC